MKRINYFGLPIVLFAAVSLWFFAGCNKSDNDNPPASGLMAFNLAPDQLYVNAAIDGYLLTPSPLTYQSYTGGYIGIVAGMHLGEFYDAQFYVPLTQSSFSTDPNKYYSLFLVGANGNYQNVFLPDNFDSLAVDSSKAYIRVLNAIPDSSQVTITVDEGGKNIFTEGLNYSTVSNMTTVKSGTPLNLVISNGGNVNASRTITFDATGIYTVLLTGLPTSSDPVQSVQIRYVENGVATGTASKLTSGNTKASE